MRNLDAFSLPMEEHLLTQVDLSIPLDMINKLAGEVRGMKEEQLQRWSNLSPHPDIDVISNGVEDVDLNICRWYSLNIYLK